MLNMTIRTNKIPFIKTEGITSNKIKTKGRKYLRHTLQSCELLSAECVSDLRKLT